MTWRAKEQKILTAFLKSNSAEFLLLYGRYRIGKTFLIREYCKDKSAVFFNSTGNQDSTFEEQIAHFIQILGDTFYQGSQLREKKNWDEAFELLTHAINTVPKNTKIVLFFDEFPWMSTWKSRLLENLDYYWKQFWKLDTRVKLIICGSSVHWIMDKIINKDELHNSVTTKILLKTLSLLDTKHFLAKEIGLRLSNEQILQIYMVTGGVPYHLAQIKKELSVLENIEQLAFKENGLLINEFNELFASLFNSHETNVEIAHNIASKKHGIGQEALFKLMRKNIKGKSGLTKLRELEDTRFITSFKSYQRKQKGIYYKVIDEYTLFYLRWIKPIKDNLKNLPASYWKSQQGSESWLSWSQQAFESICFKHIAQICKALGLPAHTSTGAWKLIEGRSEVDAQVDLLFDYEDNITLCEIKFSDKPFVIDKQYAESLKNKKEHFVKSTKTKKKIFFALIASNEVEAGMHGDLIDKVVTLDDLFTTPECIHKTKARPITSNLLKIPAERGNKLKIA